MRFPFLTKYKTLNQIIVSTSALEHNHKALQQFHPEAKICPVLKSNAYGHGLKTVAPIFDAFKPAFLVVDSLYEAYELYKLKIKTPVLVLGYTHPDNLTVKKLPFHFTVFDIETAKKLNKYQPGCSVHLFVDTGMSREGITLNEFPQFVSKTKEFKDLNIVGLASHFADADNPSSQQFTENQVKNFKKALTILEQNEISPQWKHISASGGAFKIKDPIFNMIRAGIASYGISALETKDSARNSIALKPVLKFVSTLAQIKEVSKGDKVGYNGTFTATKKMRIGFIPAGYYEGVDRRLSNSGLVKIHNNYCPIIGRVSMNMTTIDISHLPSIKVGDEVEIYSSNIEDKNSIVQASQLAGTIPYELLVHLAQSVKRSVV